MMKISFAPLGTPSKGSLIFFVPYAKDSSSTCILMDSGRSIDNAAEGAISRAIETAKFEGNVNSILQIEAPSRLSVNRILLVGVGESSKITRLILQRAGASAINALSKFKESEAYMSIDPYPSLNMKPSEIAAEIACGARLGSYRFTEYFTKPSSVRSALTVENLFLMAENSEESETIFNLRNELAEGVKLARDLVSEPGNIKYPEAIAKDIEALSEFGIEVDIIRRPSLEAMGMGALLGVSQGSIREPIVGVMRWNGSLKGPKEPPVALVGKGVTFDTGGISLKPSGGMEEMKYDMAGAGAVIGALRAIAGRKAKCNVIGVVGLVENMPDGAAQRPGDVVKTMSGQTIEVINTDAEGRLVLADVLWYTQSNFKPRAMINLATLTGAVVVSLGTHMAGVFSNDLELANKLVNAGKLVGENVWQLPLDPRYDKEINSEIADMKNVGKGREAGSITAAQLLERFVEDTPWAHIDIAGMAWMKRSDDPVVPKGASGFGVRLLDQLISSNFEV